MSSRYICRAGVKPSTKTLRPGARRKSRRKLMKALYAARKLNSIQNKSKNCKQDEADNRVSPTNETLENRQIVDQPNFPTNNLEVPTATSDTSCGNADKQEDYIRFREIYLQDDFSIENEDTENYETFQEKDRRNIFSKSGT